MAGYADIMLPTAEMKPRADLSNHVSDSTAIQKRARLVRETSRCTSFTLASLFCVLFVVTSVKAQSNTPSSGYGVGNLHHGLVVGVIAGTAAVAGVGITYLILHNRGVTVGCVTESGGRKTLVGSDHTVYSLSDTGPPLPYGERTKLRGHKSGLASSPSFQVEKVLKDYGPCQP
jgi:hypothetical protein